MHLSPIISLLSYTVNMLNSNCICVCVFFFNNLACVCICFCLAYYLLLNTLLSCVLLDYFPLVFLEVEGAEKIDLFFGANCSVKGKERGRELRRLNNWHDCHNNRDVPIKEKEGKNQRVEI